ncbi:hypothetical protein L0F51_00240 [Afifella sp. H1R]|uniref:phage head completion protein n=1 Tax=Afifella sp. H1R TaxID=2908841 RepID=UPI001F1EBDE2|nr:hypothetical protein [Afifella sp. H1R]MCF1502193.1 hypothetical protein [Afifella sp. H1R]
MSVASVIDRKGRMVALVTKTGGHYSTDPDNYGEWVPGGEATKPIKASVQPASATLLRNKPEGVQAESRLIIWTRAQISEDDIIEDDGKRYRVLDRENWSADGGYFVGYLGSLGATD